MRTRLENWLRCWTRETRLWTRRRGKEWRCGRAWQQRELSRQTGDGDEVLSRHADLMERGSITGEEELVGEGALEGFSPRVARLFDE